MAADVLEANAGDLGLADRGVSARGTLSSRVSIQDVARRAYHEPHLLPVNIEPGLAVTRRFLPPDRGSVSGSAHAAQVDFKTGWVEILRYVEVEDFGTTVNPRIVDGQVHIGVVANQAPLKPGCILAVIGRGSRVSHTPNLA